MMTQRASSQYRCPGYTQSDIVALRDLLAVFSKGVRASRQYPSNHPIPTQFESLFFRKLRGFFEGAELIALNVTHETLQVEEEVVFKSSTAPENLAGLLHRDGVRYIEISSGITAEEASSLFKAFVNCARREEDAEDIVNLFWQADFEHITYDIVDVFEISEIQELREEFDSTREPAKIDALSAENDDTLLDLPQQAFEQPADLSAYSSDEIASLQQMLEDDRTLDLRAEAIELLLLMSESSSSPQEITEIVEALQSIFDKTIHSGNFAWLSNMLHRVKTLLDSGTMDSPSARKRLTDFVARCGDSFRLKMITEAINRNEDIDLEPVRSYLSELTWESYNNLLWMLGELKSHAARKMMCDLLAEKGLDKIDLLGGGVFDSRWFLVRNVVWVLGETGHPRALGFLRRAAAHADLRVRLEVVKALAKIPDPARIDLLLEMTKDDDEKIRLMVAEELGRSDLESAYLGLRKIVLSKDFVNAPPSEMRKLMEAMVSSGGAAAVETIRGILGRSVWFNRAQVRRLQDLALLALKHSSTSESAELLTELVENQKSRYSVAAHRIMAQRQASIGKRGDDESL